MKKIIESHTYYKCEVCGKKYALEKDALDCEAKPVTHDKGAKIGSKVRILTGQGAGEEAIVEKVSVIDKYWGHYSWKRYWHTIGVEANLINRAGSRWLTFDDYELIEE